MRFIVWTMMLVGGGKDPYFVGLEKTFIFPIVSVNEMYGMQMLLFVNVIL